MFVNFVTRREDFETRERGPTSVDPADRTVISALLRAPCDQNSSSVDRCHFAQDGTDFELRPSTQCRCVLDLVAEALSSAEEVRKRDTAADMIRVQRCQVGWHAREEKRREWNGEGIVESGDERTIDSDFPSSPLSTFPSTLYSLLSILYSLFAVTVPEIKMKTGE